LFAALVNHSKDSRSAAKKEVFPELFSPTRNVMGLMWISPVSRKHLKSCKRTDSIEISFF
jgi:hypothetical protein